MKNEKEEMNSAYHWIWKCCGGSGEKLGIRRSMNKPQKTEGFCLQASIKTTTLNPIYVLTIFSFSYKNQS
jgi:hypothetical protein